MKAPAGYVENAEEVDTRLADGPLQPAPNVHPEAHTGQVVALPYELGTPLAVAHCTKVDRVQELELAGDDEPAGQGVAAAEPEGQYDAAGQPFTVPLN